MTQLRWQLNIMYLINFEYHVQGLLEIKLELCNSWSMYMYIVLEYQVNRRNVKKLCVHIYVQKTPKLMILQGWCLLVLHFSNESGSTSHLVLAIFYITTGFYPCHWTENSLDQGTFPRILQRNQSTVTTAKRLAFLFWYLIASKIDTLHNTVNVYEIACIWNSKYNVHVCMIQTNADFICQKLIFFLFFVDFKLRKSS